MKKTRKIIPCCLVFLLLLMASPWVSVPGSFAAGLPEELKGVKVGEGFVGSSAEQAGSLLTVKEKDRLVVLHRDTSEAYYGKEKDPVYQRDALYTLEDGRCRIEFKNRDVVIMAPETRLDIDEILASFLQGKKKSVFSMARGKAIFYALRLFRYKQMELEVKTPTAGIGVRGTKFGAEIERVPAGRSGGLDRMVASRVPVVAQGPGTAGNIVTRVYVFEGEVDVTSLVDGRTRRLRENEILEADQRGLGIARFNPEKTRAFLEEVASGLISEQGREPSVQDRNFLQDQVERMEQLNEIRQREIAPPSMEHRPEPPPQSPGGGHHP